MGSVGSRWQAAVLHPSAAYRHRLSLALGQAGFAVEEPPDPLTWARAGGRRVLVVSVPDAGDVDLIRRSACGGTVVAAVSGDWPLFAAALAAGAAGVVDGGRSPEAVAAAVAAATAGLVLVPRQLARELLTGVGEAVDVSDSERVLLRGLSEGLTLAAIGEVTGVSERTVRRRLGAIYGKLGVENRAQCLTEAARLHLLSAR